MAFPQTVRCHCGAVELTLAAAPLSAINCHCGLCRRLGGAAFTTWANLRAEALHIGNPDALAAYDPTPNLTRRFCRVCGTHVCTHDRRHPEVVGLPSGLLDAIDPPPPSRHYFVDHRASWHEITDGLPRRGGESGFEPVA